MKLSKLIDELDLKVFSGENCLDREASGCYIGDLLSLAMSKAQEGNVWITIQTNINVAAVAALTDAACVVIAESFEPDAAALEKAKAENIVILGSDKTAYELAVKLFGAGI